MRRIIKLVAAFLIVTMMGTLAYAQDIGNGIQSSDYDDGYNSSLELIGLTHEMYSNMPEEKRIYYADFDVVHVAKKTQYLKVTESVNPGSDENGIQAISDESNSEVIELTEEEFALELMQNFGVSSMKEAQLVAQREATSKFSTQANSNSDKVSTTWITLTTYLSYGGNDKWALSSDVTSLKNYTSMLNPFETHIIGLGTNAQFSIIPDSDYCSRKCTIYCQDPYMYIPNTTYNYDSQYCGANGYAVYYTMVETETANEVYYILAIKPNTSTATVVDGYGHYAKRSVKFTPSISISASGASMSISPSSNVTYMPNTHVQVDR